MDIFKSFGMLVLLAFAALPSAFGQNAPDAKKLVSVAVLTGDRIHRLKLGVMVFGNEYGVVKGPHPGVQAAIFSVIKTEIDRERELDVRPLQVDDERMSAWVAAKERAPRS